ncbi:MAG: hypothetical protein COU09_02145 [Candidatus Harrisonbacteria bacterium CG10_big_fil_rev_8_21_14_0_10_44_23]|uniref:Type IV secretion system coupling protein TraD DNA-binding domain-containing protein n=1 Tax=Candidatus Harrisonbacteria bacterium CG10_big_fil_rev_8_21_14_0_10_44_23 TaxID=1974585 RepID=A0A2H0UPU8_9BACT|nr:MAG: hypothetical protein COU09_02145 [Candidatus Harrisonbacteria bacterium CG10_big_fil_rev_8_21_14_0_10_44_23]
MTNNEQPQDEFRLQTVKTAPPPAELPILGQADERQVSFFGRTNYASALDEKKFVFGIKKNDRRSNMYIIGKSGVGKSKLMELMIRQDIMRGSGVCLMDPHGEMIDDLLHFIPEDRIKDVIIFDPNDKEAPIAFNPFANVHEDFRYQMAQGLIEIMQAQFGSQWSAGMEHVFRFAVLALNQYPKATVRGLAEIFNNPQYREEVAKYSSDEMVKRFWLSEYAHLASQSKMQREVITPLVNKLSQFLFDPLLGKTFSSPEHKFSVEKSIEEKKIILINLARGKLGKENSSFLASLLLLKIKQAGMTRMRLADREREDFYLYIDEFHHLVTETFENLLFEGKKYHIPLTISHQYLGQVVSHFQNSVLANIGTLVVFRLGGDDATKIESELAPIFKAKNIINLGRRQFYIKMLIDGEPHDPFSAEVLKVLSPRHKSFRREIIDAARGHYSISPESPVMQIGMKEETAK